MENKKPTFGEYLLQIVKKYYFLIILLLIGEILHKKIHNLFEINKAKVASDMFLLADKGGIRSAADITDILTTLMGKYKFLIINWLVWTGCIYYLNFLRRNLFPKMRKSIWLNYFSKVQEHSLNYFRKNLSGDIVAKMVILEDSIIGIINYGLSVVGVIGGVLDGWISIFKLNRKWALILLTWMVVHITVRNFTYFKISRALKISNDSKTLVCGFSNDSFDNQFIKSAYNVCDKEKNKMQELVDDRCTNDKHASFVQDNIRLILEIIGFAFICLFSVYFAITISKEFAYLRLEGKLTKILSENFIKCWALMWAFVGFVWRSNEKDLLENLAKASAAFNSLQTDCDEKVNGTNSFTYGSIEYKNVNFYSDNTQILKDINFTINPGEKVLISGNSGSGKSSILNLLLGAFSYEGNILINQQDMKGIDRSQIAKHIAYFSQSDMLFKRSIRENLRIIYPSMNEEVLKETAQLACVNFLDKISHGMDTDVENLSTGQKQRICIWRAFLHIFENGKNDIIMTLDESISNLDDATSQIICENIIKMKNTMIIVDLTNMFSKYVNKIIKVQDGKIISCEPNFQDSKTVE
jgi:ABC-type multidrug transport system fused ATPase/permease subunit